MSDSDAERLTSLLERLVVAAERIADRLNPPPPDVVDTPWVAERLACTTTWVADLARRGEIPPGCILPSTGNGKPWKFHRAKIEAWLASR
jgi:hypothetical protein